MTTDRGLSTDEALDAVARRASVMECLLDGPKYNRDIRDELGVSRSTAYKAVSELADLDMARRGDQGYELTVTGKLLFEEYRVFRERAADICQPGQLLAVLPSDTSIPFAFLDGAETHVSERHAPHEPVTEIESLVEEASVVKGTGPVLLPQYVELFSEQISANELEAALVFERPVFDHLTSGYEEEFKAAARSTNLTVWITNRELPYGLLLVEEPTRKGCLIVYDTAGDIKGVIVNDTERACAWGDEQWERYRDGATRVSTEVPD